MMIKTCLSEAMRRIYIEGISDKTHIYSCRLQCFSSVSLKDGRSLRLKPEQCPTQKNEGRMKGKEIFDAEAQASSV